MPDFDDRDQELLDQRIVARESLGDEPLVGDYVDFPDGTRRRISESWSGEDGVLRLQTSAGGSWHLASSGHGSFSGSLFPPIRADALTISDSRRPAGFWFFHHDHARAHNGVNVTVEVQVWDASVPPPQ
jgi:hypothetical protein